MIPKLIHFLYDKLHPNVVRFEELNPDYATCVWHRKDAPVWPAWRPVFDRCRTFADWTNLWRLSVLRLHGGWYFDTDVFPLAPIDRILRENPVGPNQMLAHPRGGNAGVDNTVLAVGPEFDWSIIDAAIAAARVPDNRLALCFELFRWLVNDHPDRFVLPDDRRVNVSVYPQTNRLVYDQLMAGEDPPEAAGMYLIHGQVGGGWEKSIGVGDTVAKIIKRFTFGLIQPCDGCRKRQDRLNRAVPYS